MINFTVEVDISKLICHFLKHVLIFNNLYSSQESSEMHKVISTVRLCPILGEYGTKIKLNKVMAETIYTFLMGP